VQLATYDQPAPVADPAPAPPADLAPPADAVPPAPPADAIPPEPPKDAVPSAPPADVAQPAPVEPQDASTVGYTKKLWQAIQAEDVHGNDALDALAQPSGGR
jgi:hypothetical protein